MKNTQNPPFLHVKCENTRKTGTKMVENTLFSQIDKILKKGDQTYYIYYN